MEIESIKKKVLEDVDPELKRKKGQRNAETANHRQYPVSGTDCRDYFTVLHVYGDFDGGWRFHVSYTSR